MADPGAGPDEDYVAIFSPAPGCRCPGVLGELDVRTVGLRTFRRGGTTDAKDCNVHATVVDVHCRWRNGGVSTQDIYDARSIKRRVRVSGAMLAEPSA